MILDCLKKEPEKRIASADELDARLAVLERSFAWSAEQASEWWESRVKGG